MGPLVPEKYNMDGAICGNTETQTEWKSAREIWPHKHLKDERVFVPCCNRNAPILETEASFQTAFSGYVAEWYFRCAPKAGCNINPGYLRTAHLRYFL